MKIEKLIEIYKEDELFIKFNPSAESELEEFSLLLEKSIETNDKNLYFSKDMARMKACETAWLYFIYQCKKIIDLSEEKEITISNHSSQFKNGIVYALKENNNKHSLIVFPGAMKDNMSVNIENKKIRADGFIEDIKNIMPMFHVNIIKKRIEKFVEFSAYCEKINLEKSLLINPQAENINKKRI